MIILFDTNVLLDAMLDREPYGKDAAKLLNSVEESILNGFIAGHTLTTIFYLVEKSRNKTIARQIIKLLLNLFNIAPVNKNVLNEALHHDFSDYEDSVTYECAKSINADGIVTRNPKDFTNSKINIYSPRELLVSISHP